jgi:hypothetical protein
MLSDCKSKVTEVHAPDEQAEAARELARLRETANENLKRIRHQLLKFLTRHAHQKCSKSEGRHILQVQAYKWQYIPEIAFGQKIVLVFNQYFLIIVFLQKSINDSSHRLSA